MMIYKCNECGAVFTEPKEWTESHGEPMAGCPECLARSFDDISDFKCEACEGVTAARGERWCDECKTVTKYSCQAAILNTARETGLNIASIVNLYEDTMNGYSFTLPQEKKAITYLMAEVVELAYHRGCSIYEALDMVEAWAVGTL